MITTDLLIVGGGIIGFSTALSIQSIYTDLKITLIEKESNLARHQSRFNSGVIHAGVYYKPGSLKAKLCREGEQEIKVFCEAYSISYKTLGKLIVATDEKELVDLSNLRERAIANKVKIEYIDKSQIRELEPKIRAEAAIYSPDTGIVDFEQITEMICKLFVERGGKVLFSTKLISGKERSDSIKVKTSSSLIEAAYLINCAGLHSDRVITALGGKPDFTIIPFRGDFFELKNQPADLARHLIYPVPDPKAPFLGVHITRKMDNRLIVGPNAVLAFKREGYRFTDFSFQDIAMTLGYSGFWKMLRKNFKIAVSELAGSLSKNIYLKRVQKYSPSIQLEDMVSYPSGVRAQAVSHDGSLIDDFHFISSNRCLHVGNAPSPAATSSIPIGRYIGSEFSRKVK